MAAGPGGVDIALLTAAAKALRDVSVLDKQFLRAREVPSPGAALRHKLYWHPVQAASNLHAASTCFPRSASKAVSLQTFVPTFIALLFPASTVCFAMKLLSARLPVLKQGAD